MNKLYKNKIIMAVITGFAIIAVVFLGYFTFGNKTFENKNPGDLIVANVATPTAEVADVVEVMNISSTVVENSSLKTYKNTKYNFSFEHPKDLRISEFKEGVSGDTILAQSEDINFQIFIMSWDETGLITPERIHQDLPNLTIEEPQYVIITKDKLTGLIFLSYEQSFGKTREVWFVKNGFLYQINTYAEQEGVVGKILESMKFFN